MGLSTTQVPSCSTDVSSLRSSIQPIKTPRLGRQPASEIPLPYCAVRGKDGHMERSEIQPDQGELGHLHLHMGKSWLSLQDSHEEVQFPKGTTMAAAEPRLILDDAAEVFQLLVAQPAFMEPAKAREQTQHESSAAEEKWLFLQRQRCNTSRRENTSPANSLEEAKM